MEAHSFFLALLVILVAARVCSEIAVRLGAPSVIGELLAGIIIGPSLFGWFEPTDMLRMLAEIGIILLLFEVGLHTDARRLAKAGKRATIVALGGFIGPFVLGYYVAHHVFELELLPSLFIGGTLTATSIGITVRVLADIGKHEHSSSQVVLGAAVLDDIMGVILLAMLFEFTTQDSISIAHSLNVFLFITLFFLIAPVAARIMSLAIRYLDSHKHNPGLIPTMIISLVLFFAWLAHEVGAPELLGGFAAGLSLSRRFFLPFGISMKAEPDFSDRLQQQMYPIVRLFTPIFFVMVGMSLSLREIDWSSPFIWTFSISLIVIATVGKFLGALFLRECWQTKVAIGLAMVPRGEVGLVFTELGRVAGIFNNEVYAGMIIVIAFTTIISPFALKWFHTNYVTCDPENEPIEAKPETT